jgi:alpha-L-rhamnosidase
MLRRGATTVWEAWDGRNSLLHSSYLHIGAWFIEGLAGIRPDPNSPGYKHIIIRPGVLRSKRLDWVKGRFESPYGTIRSEWQLRDGLLELKASVPPNTTATLFLPTADPKSVKEGGLTLGTARGVRRLRDERGHSVLELQPGHYTFETAF